MQQCLRICVAHVCVSFVRCGLGEEREFTEVLSESALCATRTDNSKLVRGLREDSHSETLLEHCRQDYKLGRMDCPRLAHECDLKTITLSPRFRLEQGMCRGCFGGLFLHIRAVLCAARSQAGRQREGKTDRRHVTVRLQRSHIRWRKAALRESRPLLAQHARHA